MKKAVEPGRFPGHPDQEPAGDPGGLPLHFGAPPDVPGSAAVVRAAAVGGDEDGTGEEPAVGAG